MCRRHKRLPLERPPLRTFQLGWVHCLGQISMSPPQLAHRRLPVLGRVRRHLLRHQQPQPKPLRLHRHPEAIPVHPVPLDELPQLHHLEAIALLLPIYPVDRLDPLRSNEVPPLQLLRIQRKRLPRHPIHPDLLGHHFSSFWLADGNLKDHRVNLSHKTRNASATTNRAKNGEFASPPPTVVPR